MTENDMAINPTIRYGTLAYVSGGKIGGKWQGNVYTVNLDGFHVIPITDSQSDKWSSIVASTWIIWKDITNPAFGFLWGIQGQGEEIQLSFQSDGAVASFDVLGNTLVYFNANNQMKYVDLDTLETSIIVPYNPDNAPLWTWHPILTEDSVYYSDYRLNDNFYRECGASIIRHDLITHEEEVVVPTGDRYGSGGYACKMIGDVWEDWMVYEDYSETIRDEGQTHACANANNSSDVFLHYLPTGEEWNLSDAPDRQTHPKMWDHLVIWEDERDGHVSWGDLYGIDLCQHPELKYRFESCGEK